LQRLAELEFLIHNVRTEVHREAGDAQELFDAAVPLTSDEPSVAEPAARGGTERDSDLGHALRDVEQPRRGPEPSPARKRRRAGA
jgi:hypothetical protein